VNDGCAGGWMVDAYDFTKVNGIIDWDDYSRTYNGRKNMCNEPSVFTERFYNTDGFEEDDVSN